MNPPYNAQGHELVCRQCSGSVAAYRSRGGPGGWLYHCNTEGCYGCDFGWHKGRLLTREEARAWREDQT